MSCYIILDQHECVHGDASIQHDISFQSSYGKVEAWCEYSSRETDDRIAS